MFVFCAQEDVGLVECCQESNLGEGMRTLQEKGSDSVHLCLTAECLGLSPSFLHVTHKQKVIQALGFLPLT